MIVVPGRKRTVVIHQHAGGADVVAQYVFYAPEAADSNMEEYNIG